LDRNWYDLVEFGYPVTEELEGYQWLAGQGNTQDIVLSDEYDGTLLQAFSTKRAYLTYWLNVTMDDVSANQLIVPARDRVFREQMGKAAACTFLKEKQISFVFYGTLEHLHHFYAGFGQDLDYPCLIESYRNAKVVIYKVK
jgi:hypothetical protein